MSAFWSRIAIAAVGLPAVFGLAWEGGWWILALAAAAGLVALHEFFGLTRPMRPVVLAGYAGMLLTLVGASLGGPGWMSAGFLVTLPVAFVLKGFGDTRAPVVVSVATTMFGAAWVGLGLAHLLLLRDIPEHGRLAIFTVLIAVFASDTAAYFGGRMFGRRRLAPTISPGKTWEGFVFGSAAAIFAAWICLYKTGFLDGGRSILLGAVIAIVGPLGDLFESALKREVGVKDSGRLLAGHGGMLDRVDAHLFASIASFYLIAGFGATSIH
jgi:phosphatidate cytidylyltransferase